MNWSSLHVLAQALHRVNHVFLGRRATVKHTGRRQLVLLQNSFNTLETSHYITLRTV